MKDGARTFLIVIATITAVVVVGICPLVYVYFNGFAGIEPSVVNGEEDWKRRAAEWKANQKEREREIYALALDRRYVEHPFFDDTKTVLYERRDFDTVESRLSDQFERVSDPYQAYLYELYVDYLTEILFRDDPYKMLPVLDEWVNSRPNSYYARLARASFYCSFGWYFRGDLHISKASRKSREKFEYYYELARKDLSTARELNDQDWMVFVIRLEIAYKTGESRETIGTLFRGAISMQPMSFHARIMRFRAALPSWRGSWAEVDSVIAEAESHLDEFPLLGVVRLRAEAQMGSRSEAHKDALGKRERSVEWAQPYLNQLKRNPDEPLLMMAAMWYMVEGGEDRKVDALYRQIGTNYYDIYDGQFRDVLQYNGRRAFVYARAANLIKNKRERLERAKEAVEIGPDHYYTNYVMGRALLNSSDNQGAMDYLRRSIEINPDYLWAHYLLARAEEKSGKKQDALERVQALLEGELDPDLRENCEALVRRNS